MVIGNQFPSAWDRYPPQWMEARRPSESAVQIAHNYVLPFEVTSVLILVAVLGAVVLAKKEF